MTLLKGKLGKCTNELDQLRQFVASMRANGDVMWQMANFNQTMRRRAQHELHQKRSECDTNNNKLFTMEQASQLGLRRYEVLEEQFTLLFNSIQSISNAKNIEDKYDQKIAQLNKQVQD